MTDQIPEEQQNELLPLLRPLADVIANDGDVDKALDDILRNSNLSKEERVTKELDSWIKILQEYHINSDAKQKEYVARLMELGIPQASAELALARTRETVPSDVQFELTRHNYVRAVMLAEQNHYPQEKIRQFQELALRQYVSDYRNLLGFQKLVQEWEIPQSEVKRILDNS